MLLESVIGKIKDPFWWTKRKDFKGPKPIAKAMGVLVLKNVRVHKNGNKQ